jgi:sodium transport system permease protein
MTAIETKLARGLAATRIVFGKEIVDALRDRRTLLMVILSSVLMGPVVLVLMSTLVGGMERRAEAREIVVAGIEHAPEIENFLERQSYTIKKAPPDYEQQVKDSKLGDPVLVIPKDFQTKLAQGRAPQVEVISSAANQRAQGSVGRITGLIQSFNSERAMIQLAVRGVSPALLEPVDVERRDLANPATRAAQLTRMVSFFVLFAVLYGVLTPVLDTTAGERERGSLEPLLMTPPARGALVTGKWAAAAAVGMLVAVLSVLSFLPGQWLIRSETLQAMFQFGAREALVFLALLVPFAASLAALMMAIAIRCKTYREAQTSNSIVIMVVSFVPFVQIFNQTGEQPWYVAVPALGQITLMDRVLKGEPIGVDELGLSLAVCALLTAAAVWYVARALQGSVVR